MIIASVEARRKAVHISMIAWALLIGRLDPWLVNGICALALLFNIILLRKLTGGALERPDERARGYSIGLLAYPATLLFIGVVWSDRQIIMATAWSALAFGDGTASLAGRRFASPALPWNGDKTLAGLCAFVAASFVGGWILTTALLSDDLREGVSLARWAAVLAFASLAGGFVESLEGFVDDNISAPLAAAVAASAALQFPSALPPLPPDWIWGIVAVGVFAVVSFALRKIDATGAVAGWFCAFALFVGGGWTALGLLLLFFAGGSFASAWGYERKKMAGTSQEREGMRSATNAFANAGVAALCALAAWAFPEAAEMYIVMLAASLAAAASDTFSSELGSLYGITCVHILTLKPARRGEDGAISLAGTLWGVVGAAFIAAGLYVGSLAVDRALFDALFSAPDRGFSPERILAIVLGAGFAANLLDSVLGASLQRRGLMNNHSVNFVATLFAALLARVCLAL